MPGASDTQRGNEGLQAGFEPSAAERRKGGSALEDHHVRGTVSETGLQIVTEPVGRRRSSVRRRQSASESGRRPPAHVSFGAAIVTGGRAQRPGD
ncbi:hypothetical protein DGM85_18980 [Xanthomonas phaseoli pv. phaseoli]|nr:hypothetical protein DGM93_03740 [Xanthomonas phaseoli pv. phaseoli]QWN30256.1 hypothetical protein DGM85_18980 [Xanthomonas phaseoli pv. phaseoli]QWN35115.1 hypothetical protein DGM81_03755 [Xanthomonas phaseoli pv. phaseoli]